MPPALVSAGVTDDWRSDRVWAALLGENPTVLRRLDAGFAVIGDVQFLPGYSVLITDTPGTDRLTDLPRPAPGTALGAAHDSLRSELGTELDRLRAAAAGRAAGGAAYGPNPVRWQGTAVRRMGGLSS